MTLSGLDTPLDQFQQRQLDRLRYTVTESNLLRHLDGSPRRVLDVAGGDGVEAVRWASMGHEVTVLDPAGAMLSRAIETAENHDVTDRLNVVQAGALDAPEVFAGHEFDLVLCHNLLHYVDDRAEVLSAVTAPLRPGGLLSVLGPNDDFAPVHTAVRDLDPDGAMRSLPEVAESSASSAGEVMVLLVELGLAEIVRYGVRCVTDLLDVERVEDKVFYADLMRLELAMSNQMPQLLTARYFHLVARR